MRLAPSHLSVYLYNYTTTRTPPFSKVLRTQLCFWDAGSLMEEVRVVVGSGLIDAGVCATHHLT